MNDRWHCVGHVAELANPGDFLCLPVGPGQHIAVMNYEGYLHAWDGRCPHRGALIFSEVRGNRPPVCGYHNRCAKPGLIKTMPMRQIGGFIFVLLGDANEYVRRPWQSSEWQDDRLLLKSHQGLRYRGQMQFIMDCDWTVAVENALDLEHVPHVHAASLAKMGLTRDVVDCYEDGSSVERMQSSQALRLDRLEPFFRQPDEHGRQLFDPGMMPGYDYEHSYFYPYAALSSTRGFTYSLQNYFPMADGRTWFMHRLYTSPAPRALDSYFDSVTQLNEQVFWEDAAICATVPAGFEGQLGPRDERIANFRAQLKIDRSQA